MEFASVNRSDLRSAVRAIEPLADFKSPIIYRSAIEIEARGGKITVRITDSESEAGAAIVKNGSGDFKTLINAKVFRKALDAFEDEVVFIANKDDEITLKNNSSRNLSISTIENSKLPDPIDPGAEIASGSISAKDFSAALVKVIKIAKNADPSRPIINSVVFKQLDFLGSHYLNIVATDGHRLIEAPIEIFDLDKSIFEKEFVWPIESIKALSEEVQRWGKQNPDARVTITDFENLAEVSFNSRFWRSAGLNGSYPDTDSIFKKAKGDNLLGFDRGQMIKSLKALAAVSVGDAPVVLKLSGKLEIDYKVPDMAKFEEVLDESIYQGEAQEIAFNHKYLAELCQLIEGEDFFDELKSTDQIKARVPNDANAVLFYGDSYVRVLLMPIRH